MTSFLFVLALITLVDVCEHMLNSNASVAPRTGHCELELLNSVNNYICYGLIISCLRFAAFESSNGFASVHERGLHLVKLINYI